MSQKYEKLKTRLKALFQLDQPADTVSPKTPALTGLFVPAKIRENLTKEEAGEAGVAGGGGGKLLSPERRRCAVGRAREQYGISERHGCRLLGQWRGTQRYEPMDRPDEDELTRAVLELATQ